MAYAAAATPVTGSCDPRSSVYAFVPDGIMLFQLSSAYAVSDSEWRARVTALTVL
jgi:hypothetical protein